MYFIIIITSNRETHTLKIQIQKISLKYIQKQAQNNGMVVNRIFLNIKNKSTHNTNIKTGPSLKFLFYGKLKGN